MVNEICEYNFVDVQWLTVFGKWQRNIIDFLLYLAFLVFKVLANVKYEFLLTKVCLYNFAWSYEVTRLIVTSQSHSRE